MNALNGDDHKASVGRIDFLSPLLVALAVNVIAGLITAGILLFATTTVQVGIVLLVVSLMATIAIAVSLALHSRKLGSQLQVLEREGAERERFSKLQMQRLGIVEFSDTLGASRWSPDAVMGRAHSYVRFLGVFGHKWVMDAKRQALFKAMLRRIQLNGGTVQFLLLDPNGAGAVKLAAFRNLDLNTYENFSSIEFYKGLSSEFPCFQLKLYDNFPFLRLIFVDGRCAVSRFKVDAGPEETLKAPQIAFESQPPSEVWTLYQAFALLYEFLWTVAKPK